MRRRISADVLSDAAKRRRWPVRRTRYKSSLPPLLVISSSVPPRSHFHTYRVRFANDRVGLGYFDGCCCYYARANDHGLIETTSYYIIIIIIIIVRRVSVVDRLALAYDRSTYDGPGDRKGLIVNYGAVEEGGGQTSEIGRRPNIRLNTRPCVCVCVCIGENTH
jgi:hypothetical protein